MSKPKPYSKIRPGISHGESIRLAVASKEEAIKRNEELKSLGIAAEHPVRADGQLMPLVYRDRQARVEVAKAFGLPLEDY
jgi:hypothetical protein